MPVPQTEWNATKVAVGRAIPHNQARRVLREGVRTRIGVSIVQRETDRHLLCC
jgi:hypothetical protein